MESKFIHNVSKGSRFNQIYIPKSVEKKFEVGDTVEVKLIKKKKLIFTHNVTLSAFKKKLIEEVFKFLSKYKEIERVIFFGSFLTEVNTYRDIDISIIVKKEKDELLEKITLDLGKEFNLKFHIIISEEQSLMQSLEFSPLTRSMFYRHVSNKKFNIPSKRIIDKNHLSYILMMPDDLVNLVYKMNSRTYYDSLRRLLIIEMFLNKEDEDALKAKKIIEKLLGKELFIKCIENKIISKEETEKVKKIMSHNLELIKRRLKNG